MMFKDLKIGDSVFILENTGTFRKINTYNVGTITQIGQLYDDMTNTNPYMSQQTRKKLIDITITCDGVQKKLTVGADRVTMTDSVIGLTLSTDKSELVTQVSNQCRDYEQKIKAIEYYKEELKKCQNLLGLLENKPNHQSTMHQDVESIETIKVS